MYKINCKGERPFAPIRAFTLIELLVVIAIIGLLVTLSVLALSNARVASRDAKRVSDVKQMQSALELFFDANSRYPTNAEFQSGSLKSYASTTGTTTYMGVIPAAPTPNDGSCSTSSNNYVYIAPADGSTYTLSFCVAKNINDLPSGRLAATPGGMAARGFQCGDSIMINALAGHTCNTGAPDYDTCTYDTVSIGSQCWLKQNLNIGMIVTGTTTQSNTPPILEKYCYSNNYANCQTQGGLYQWDEAMQYGSLLPDAQGICPTGWHIPSDAEQNTLDQYLTDYPNTCNAGRNNLSECANAGGKLKETGTIYWNSPNTGATNSSGFTGLPAGYRYADGSFYSQGAYAYFWSSSVSGTSAWRRSLVSGGATVNRFAGSWAYGFSVRCLRD